MLGQYGFLYILLGICVAALVLVAYGLYRQHAAKLKHGPPRRHGRKFGRRQHRHDQL